MVQRSEELSHPFALTQHGAQQFSLCCRHRYASEVSPPSQFPSESGAAPTLTHQQPCAVVSLAGMHYSLSGQTELHPDCIRFSCSSPIVSASACCSPIVSACYHAHTVQSIINSKVVHHYCSPTSITYRQTDRQTDRHTYNLNVMIAS